MIRTITAAILAATLVASISGAVYAGGIDDCSKQSSYQGDRPWCLGGPGSGPYGG